MFYLFSFIFIIPLFIIYLVLISKLGPADSFQIVGLAGGAEHGLVGGGAAGLVRGRSTVSWDGRAGRFPDAPDAFLIIS